MKILVLNCGSSSIKYKLFDMESKSVMAQGGIEKIGLPDSFLQVKLPNGEKVKFEKSMPEHTVGIELILEKLVDPQVGCIKDLKEINAVGHRVVHGGTYYSASVVIDEKVKEAIKGIYVGTLHVYDHASENEGEGYECHEGRTTVDELGLEYVVEVRRLLNSFGSLLCECWNHSSYGSQRQKELFH